MARKRIAVLVAACGGIQPATSFGEIAFGVGTELEYTNNSTHAPNNGRQDTISTVFGGMAYRDRNQDSETRFRAVGGVHRYRNGTFGDQSFGDIDAYGLWSLSPQFFSWTLEDRFRQVVVNPLLADTPANRQNANVVATGPNVTLRVNPVNALNLGARYGKVHVRDNNLDNDRQVAYAQWRYDTSSITVLSANYEYTDVSFRDSVTNSDFSRRNTFLRIETRPVRSLVTIDLGTTTIDRDRLPTIEGNMARFRWDREISGDTRFGLGVASGYSDVGAELSPATQGSEIIFSQGNAVVSSDIFYSKRIDVQYSTTGTLGWTLAGYGRDLDYETVPLDREERSGQLEVTFTPSPSNAWAAFGRRLKTTFTNIMRDDDERSWGLRYSRLLGRGFTFNLRGERLKRTSTDVTQTFVEDRFMMSFAYSTSSLFTR